MKFEIEISDEDFAKFVAPSIRKVAIDELSRYAACEYQRNPIIRDKVRQMWNERADSIITDVVNNRGEIEETVSKMFRDEVRKKAKATLKALEEKIVEGE